VSSKGKPEEGLEEDEEEEMGGKIKYQPTKNYMGMLEYKKEEEAALVKPCWSTRRRKRQLWSNNWLLVGPQLLIEFE